MGKQIRYPQGITDIALTTRHVLDVVVTLNERNELLLGEVVSAAQESKSSVSSVSWFPLSALIVTGGSVSNQETLLGSDRGNDTCLRVLGERLPPNSAPSSVLSENGFVRICTVMGRS